MTDESSPKFRRRADARPDEILDAALALFTAKGFAQTRVEEIAEAAGLSKGTVYLYFASKDAILEGLVLRAVAPVADFAVERLADHSAHPRETLGRVMHAVAAKLERPETLAVPLLVIREAASAPDIARVYREKVLMRIIPAIRALIADAVARGILRPVDPDLTVRSLIGPVIAHLLLSEAFGIRPEGGLRLDRLIDNHLDIVFSGLEPRSETA